MRLSVACSLLLFAALGATSFCVCAAQSPLSFPLRLRPGMSQAEVELVLGPRAADENKLWEAKWSLDGEVAHVSFVPSEVVPNLEATLEAEIRAWRRRGLKARTSLEMKENERELYRLPSRKLMAVTLVQPVADCSSLRAVAKDAENYIVSNFAVHDKRSMKEEMNVASECEFSSTTSTKVWKGAHGLTVRLAAVAMPFPKPEESPYRVFVTFFGPGCSAFPCMRPPPLRQDEVRQIVVPK